MSSELNHYPLTSYITDRSPNFYGGHQEEYLEMAEKAIESGVSLISDKILEKTDSADIYPTVIKAFQAARHEIALRHQPEFAHLFGIRRDDPTKTKGIYTTSVTGLYGQYSEYNQKYLEQLTKILHKLPHNLYSFSKTSTTLNEVVLGKNYSFQVEILDPFPPERHKYTIAPSEKEINEALEIEGKTFQEITSSYDLMKQLKDDHKNLYDRLIIYSILSKMNEDFPSPKRIGEVNGVRFEQKSLYVLTTVRLEAEPKKMFCLGRHLTWMYQNYTEDPIDRMKGHSVDYVVHQDPFLIQRTQKFCSQIFAEILAWDKTQSIESLQNRVALLRFVYGHSMPCSRGDGAIGDWLELALYRHHGFKNTRHVKGTLPCFELFSSPKLSDYLTNYKKTVIIE